MMNIPQFAPIATLVILQLLLAHTRIARGESLISPLMTVNKELFEEQEVYDIHWVDADNVLVTTAGKRFIAGHPEYHLWLLNINTKLSKYYKAGLVECLDPSTKEIIINSNQAHGRAPNADGVSARLAGRLGAALEETDIDRTNERINRYNCTTWQIPKDRSPAEKRRAGFWTYDLHEKDEYVTLGRMSPKAFDGYSSYLEFSREGAYIDRRVAIEGAQISSLEFVPFNQSYFIRPRGVRVDALMIKDGAITHRRSPPAEILNSARQASKGSKNLGEYFSAIPWRYGEIWSFVSQGKGMAIMTHAGQSDKIVYLIEPNFAVIKKSVSPDGCSAIIKASTDKGAVHWNIYSYCGGGEHAEQR